MHPTTDRGTPQITSTLTQTQKTAQNHKKSLAGFPQYPHSFPQNQHRNTRTKQSLSTAAENTAKIKQNHIVTGEITNIALSIAHQNINIVFHSFHKVFHTTLSTTNTHRASRKQKLQERN